MKQRAAAIGVVAFLGMIDALYLTVMRGVHVPCSLSGGCNEVLTSTYSEIFGIPLSLIGLAFYLCVFSLAVLGAFDAAAAARFQRWILWLAAPGFIVTLGLFYLQGFVIHHFCQYCLASAAFVTAIFILSVWPPRFGQIQN
jgi:uncharacterized membrane protein